MRLTLRVWRQANADAKGTMVTYHLDDVEEDMSFLEMLDVLNERLNSEGEEPVAFDSDCREGICGSCGLMINGEALRHDDEYAYVAAWEWTGEGEKPVLHKENLTYEFVEMKQRSYK